MSVKVEIPMILSSASEDGATNISADGSRFAVTFDEPLAIPSNAVQCYASVEDAQIWNTVPNILTGINDLFFIDEGAGFVMVTVDSGLYDIGGLQEAIDRNYVALGGTSGVFSFLADDATQKVVIQLNIAGVQIDFTQPQTMRAILGFNATLVPPGGPSVGLYTELAPNVAMFNTLEYFLLHSDIVNSGIRTNTTYTQTIAKIPISSAPGSQILYTPYNPPKSNTNNLIGAIKNRLNFWLTDQSNNPVNTSGESYAFRLKVEYSVAPLRE